MPIFVLLALLGASVPAIASTSSRSTIAREGSEYALQASDGRWLVADAAAGRPRLLPDASAGAARRKFTFVRVPGQPDTAYLKFGDVLLTAHSSAADSAADPAIGAQFRLLTRPHDGKVALSAAWGTLLRPGTSVASDGSVELEQGGDQSDEAVWWRLCAVKHDGSIVDAGAHDECVEDEEQRRKRVRGQQAGARSKYARPGSLRARSMALRGAASSRASVYATSGALVLGSTAAMLPADALVHVGVGAVSLASSASLHLQASVLGQPTVATTLAAATRLRGALARTPAVAASLAVASRLSALAVARLGEAPGQWAGQVVGAAVVAVQTVASGTLGTLARLRTTHELGAVLTHGLITDGISDVLAQAISSPSAAVELDWGRVARSTSVAFLSDDLPFALWAKLLWDGFEKLRPLLLTSSALPPWLAALLASPLGVAVLKTALSHGVYETFSTATYLGLQEAARGGGLRRVWREIRSKFWRAWTAGFLFFSSTHLLMFLTPVWWMQPILDNLSCLIFNTYLAVLSHEASGHGADDDAPATTPRMAEGSIFDALPQGGAASERRLVNVEQSSRGASRGQSALAAGS